MVCSFRDFPLSMNCKTHLNHHLMNLDRNNHVIIVMLSDRKLHTHWEHHRETRSLNNTLLLSGPSQEPPAPLHKPRGAPRHKGRQEPKLRAQRKGHPVQVPLQAVQGSLSPSVQVWHHAHGCSSPDQLSDWGTWLPRGVGHIITNYVIHDNGRLTMGCLGQEPKVGKWRDHGGLGRNNKIEG